MHSFLAGSGYGFDSWQCGMVWVDLVFFPLFLLRVVSHICSRLTGAVINCLSPLFDPAPFFPSGRPLSVTTPYRLCDHHCLTLASNWGQQLGCLRCARELLGQYPKRITSTDGQAGWSRVIVIIIPRLRRVGHGETILNCYSWS